MPIRVILDSSFSIYIHMSIIYLYVHMSMKIYLNMQLEQNVQLFLSP